MKQNHSIIRPINLLQSGLFYATYEGIAIGSKLTVDFFLNVYPPTIGRRLNPGV